MLLEQFRAAKSGEIAQLRALEKSNNLPAPLPIASRPDFLHALQHPPYGNLAVIAEFKQASPSRGTIIKGLSPENIAQEYATAGASCISVLTEEKFFGGKLDFLSRMSTPGIPLLRKDFIFDALQVIATAATPASALLLIVRLTPNVSILRNLRQLAESYGIHAVVEIFDETDLALARSSGARIIQVNARDLDTLKTDRKICLNLATHRLAHETWIAASAMSNPKHLIVAHKAGYNAALIGTALMESGTPGASLARLLKNTHHE